LELAPGVPFSEGPFPCFSMRPLTLRPTTLPPKPSFRSCVVFFFSPTKPLHSCISVSSSSGISPSRPRFREAMYSQGVLILSHPAPVRSSSPEPNLSFNLLFRFSLQSPVFFGPSREFFFFLNSPFQLPLSPEKELGRFARECASGFPRRYFLLLFF